MLSGDRPYFWRYDSRITTGSDAEYCTDVSGSLVMSFISITLINLSLLSNIADKVHMT